MILSFKNKFLIAATFSIYQLLINWYFASYQFLESNFSLWIYFLSVFIIFFCLEISYLHFLLKTLKEKGVNKMLFSSSFLSIGIVGSSILWLLFTSNKQHYFVYVISFFIASFVPTLLFLFYFIYKETEEKFSKLGNVSLKTDESSKDLEDKIFSLENANGKLLLEVPIRKIICFEANDNYVVTYFLKSDNNISKSMERISLKKIEEMLDAEEVIFNRVHKSYLINPEFVEEVKGRAQAYKIKLYYLNNLIPVSRSYDINLINK